MPALINIIIEIITIDSRAYISLSKFTSKLIKLLPASVIIFLYSLFIIILISLTYLTQPSIHNPNICDLPKIVFDHILFGNHV